MRSLSKIFSYQFFLRIFSRVEKRQRFIIATLLLTLTVLSSSFLNFSEVRYFIFVVAAVSYLLTFFSILEGISKVEWLMLFVVPVYFTISLILFYFLLPVRWLTRLPFVLIYAISIYALLLSSNIINVGVVKTLQLFRAAFSINFLYLTITSYLVFNLILSFKLSFVYNFFLVMILSFPLVLQFLWSIEPKDNLERQLLKYSFLISFILAQGVYLLSFMPIRTTIFALFLTASFYSLLGLFQAYLEERLFKERIREFVFVIIFVFIIVILSAKWW